MWLLSTPWVPKETILPMSFVSQYLQHHLRTIICINMDRDSHGKYMFYYERKSTWTQVGHISLTPAQRPHRELTASALEGWAGGLCLFFNDPVYIFVL